MVGKTFLQDLSVEKTMNGKSLLFEAEDMTAIIHHMIATKKNENKFRFLHQCYQRMKRHVLAKNIDIEEVLNYVVSYFTILFTSPDALDVTPTEVKQTVQIPGSLAGMPAMPPGMDANPALAQMMQMLMQGQSQGQVTEEIFTNIENEFYTAVAEEGIIVSDKEFMDKVLEECKDECFELIIRKAYCEIDELSELKTLNKCVGVCNVLGR